MMCEREGKKIGERQRGGVQGKKRRREKEKTNTQTFSCVLMTVEPPPPLLPPLWLEVEEEEINDASMLTDAMSLTMTATLRPSLFSRILLRSVVFPEPRKPLRRVTGRAAAGELRWPERAAVSTPVFLVFDMVDGVKNPEAGN